MLFVKTFVYAKVLILLSHACVYLPLDIDIHQRPPLSDIDETQSRFSKTCLCLVLIVSLIIVGLAVALVLAIFTDVFQRENAMDEETNIKGNFSLTELLNCQI